MVKHTPGPWLVVDDLDIVSRFAIKDGGVEVATCGTSIQEFYETAKANAALIAAAPELLEALERLSVFAEQMFASFAPVEQEELRPDLELAEAAIRKAKDSALQEILPEKKEA